MIQPFHLQLDLKHKLLHIQPKLQIIEELIHIAFQMLHFHHKVEAIIIGPKLSHMEIIVLVILALAAQ